MIVLADNDVLLKLAQCDLFNEFLTAFGVTANQVTILKAARFSMGTKRTRDRIGVESSARLSQILHSVGDILTPPDPSYVAALNEQIINGIDAGEAALFAICSRIETSVIVTGDKRSLAGLTTASLTDGACAQVCDALAGRVHCFEQVILRIVGHAGFDYAVGKLLAGRECDRGLSIWLGTGTDASEAIFRAGLDSFLGHARSISGRLLATD